MGYDTIPTHTAGTAAQNIQNKYQFLSVPVSIGFRFNIKDKLFVAPQICISLDYLLPGSSFWADTKTDELKLYPYSYDINLGLRFKL